MLGTGALKGVKEAEEAAGLAPVETAANTLAYLLLKKAAGSNLTAENLDGSKPKEAESVVAISCTDIERSGLGPSVEQRSGPSAEHRAELGAALQPE